MKVFLPIIQDMINQLSEGDNIEAGVLLQKQILKIFYALIQYTMPLTLINGENFAIWMEIICRILAKEVPSFVDEYDECDRNESAWWKIKKWCCHITSRIFERYGSPGNVDDEYQGLDISHSIIAGAYERIVVHAHFVGAALVDLNFCVDPQLSAF